MGSDQREDGEYMFKRNYKSSLRQNYNHFLMKGISGYLLHPAIPVKSTEGLRIADVGAGTGIWALELAATLPESVHFDCFDISPEQYPAEYFRPANVRFHVHDCFDAFPDEYIGQFDIVHARFWLCCVNDPQAVPLLKRLNSLLKPGGYLQWFEPLPLLTKVVSRNPGASQQASEKIAASWKKPTPQTSYGWVEDRPNLLKEQDMDDVTVSDHHIPEHFRTLWAQSSLSTTEDVISKINLWNEDAEGMKKLVVDLQEEIANGVAVDTPFQCVIGRKKG